jgi:ribosome biogenesis GTPase
MRVFGLWDADEGIDETFSEIVEMAAGCRFRDCGHALEPGCAVRAAVADGRLDAARLEGYRKLGDELGSQLTEAERREAKRQFFKSIEVAAHARARRRNDGWRDR